MVVVFIISIIIIIWHDRWWRWWWWSDLTRKTKQKMRRCTKTSRVGKVSPRGHRVELCIRNEARTLVIRGQSIEKPRSKNLKNVKLRPHRGVQGLPLKGEGEQTRAKRLGWAVWNLPLSLQQHTCPILTPFPPPLSPIRVLLSISGDWNAAFTHDKDVVQ